MNSNVSRIALAGGLVVFALAAAARSPDKLEYAEQGWSRAERSAWYAATQGSRLMPASWLRALEQAENQEPFLSPEHMARYRYISNETNPAAPYPIGFAEDRQSDRNFRQTKLRWYAGQGDKEKWVGLNCAACHTADITYGGQRMRVDGAPAISDFQGFVEAVDRALLATKTDPAKFQRFASAVLGRLNSPANQMQLRGALGQLYDWQLQIEKANASSMRYGFARLDAFGHIFNRASIFTGDPSPTPQPSDAPVSYPFLWNTSQHDRVQWNGAAGNERTPLGRGRYADLSALGRNAGEVIGVFGEVVPRPFGTRDINGLHSSIFVDNLEKMEKLVEKLQSPAWPRHILGNIDETKASRGASLFQQKCASCHKPLGRQDLNTKVVAQMSYFQPEPGSRAPHRPPGTDPVMACNAYNKESGSGVLAGLRYKDEFGTEQRVPPKTKVAIILPVMVKKALLNQKGEIVTTVASVGSGARRNLVVHNDGEYPREGALRNWFQSLFRRAPSGLSERIDATQTFIAPAAEGGAQPVRSNTMNWGSYDSCVNGAWSRIKGYKARPLNGIWATAPYLHNGSVPNLYELLLPPQQRLRHFYVGSREFDPRKVGYVTDQSAQNSFRFDAYKPNGEINWGNWNGGHDYGNASLTEDQRLDLLEYMKSI